MSIFSVLFINYCRVVPILMEMFFFLEQTKKEKVFVACFSLLLLSITIYSSNCISKSCEKCEKSLVIEKWSGLAYAETTVSFLKLYI